MRLNGHSGCVLTLKERNGKYCVEKKSSRYEYNGRLKKQCMKQCHFSSDVFRSVAVLDYGYDRDGFFYFEMEYIPGITLAEYMRDISLYEIEALAEKLFSGINASAPYDACARIVFKNKVDEVSECIRRQGLGIDEVIDMLKGYEWPYMIHSDCHGDFTLENMMVYQDQIFLLDFLDSFYDSWIIDFAKVMQDVDIFWHYRGEQYINNNLYIRLLILKESLIGKILCLPNGRELMESVYYTLLLNVLRIFPYTADLGTVEYLRQKAGYICKRIKEKQWR